MNKCFSKSFINSELKVKKTITMLRQSDIDVLFMQEVNS